MPNPEVTICAKLNAGGKHLLRDGKAVYSTAAFKEDFAVGSLIRGPGTVVGKITAIGEKRFLYRITRHSTDLADFEERVGTIRSFTGWGKV